MLDKLTKVIFNPDLIPDLVREYNEYIATKSGGARERLDALKAQIKDIDRKINNAVNLMIETGSAALKNKLSELEETKEKLRYELDEVESTLSQEQFSEQDIRKLFSRAEKQLKNGTLANRRMIIDQYIDKVVIYKDRIEVYMNLISDYVVKEVKKQ